MKWKEQAVSPMLLVLIKKRTNIFFMIVQQKVPMAAEVFVTTVKRWIQEKKINRKIMRWIWLQPMGIRTFIRRTVPEIAETWKFRYENIELDKNACRYQKTWRCPLL